MSSSVDATTTMTIGSIHGSRGLTDTAKTPIEPRIVAALAASVKRSTVTSLDRTRAQKESSEENPDISRIAYRNILKVSRQLSEKQVSPSNITGMQKWEGRVLRIVDDFFEAELSPIDHDGPTVVADFEVSQISEQLAPDSLHVGDLFYVTVRTVTDAGNVPLRTSALRIKRVGRWVEEELDRIKESAARRSAEFKKYVD
ncbi:hypothetical protein [Amycolatopsis japonica]